ncbi:hypothetical protein BH09PSE4_BH09PSE4_20830 [soil metagenome]
MKRVFALIAIALFATGAAKKPAARVPAARDWTKTVGRTADGAYMIGNPAAKVRLIEYASYTCPHCAHFAAESESVLKRQMVRSGRVSMIFRHALRDPMDLTAALLARCTRTGFSSASDAIFAAQGEWEKRGATYLNDNNAQIAAISQDAQLKAIATGSGLRALMRKRGLTNARIDACLADASEQAVLAKMADDAWATIKGTPTFVLDGTQIDMATWETLEPLLRAAGAK